MKRQHSFLSPVSLGMVVVFFLGMGFTLWRNGGMAFNPGPLTGKSTGISLGGFSSHAAFENQCSLCHQPLQSNQAPLCLKCHQDVDTEIKNKQGVHSQVENVQSCSTCHPDHRGRDFDPTLAALPFFDHSKTRFSLVKHTINYQAAPMECSACHSSSQAGFKFVADSCQTCHAAHDATFMAQHLKDFGSDCVACHDGKDRMVSFDHSQTAFPLAGQHLQTPCSGCHHDPNFKQTPAQCVGCHTEPAVHKGVFGTDCQTCHTPEAWKPASLDGKPFNHAQTAFSLIKHSQDYQGQTINCSACHGSNVNQFDSQTCITCHTNHDATFMSAHQAQYGSNCLQCHDGIDRMHGFQHANVFPLDGKHATLDCTACHANQVFRDTPSQCSGCHAEPDIHKGFFGLLCQECHTTDSWSPALLKMHAFPLNHGNQGAVPCKTCHPDTLTQYTCYGCHDHQADEIKQSHTQLKISAQELPNCTECHPTGQKKE